MGRLVEDGSGGDEAKRGDGGSVADLPHVNADLVAVLRRAGVVSVADVAMLEHGDLMELTGLGTLEAVDTLKAARAQAGVSPERVRREKKRKDESLAGGLKNVVTDQVMRMGKQRLRNLWRQNKPRF